MRLVIPFIFLILPFAGSAERTLQGFDDAWKFHKGDVSGAQAPYFNDDTWRMVDLPHDWSIEDPAGKDTPFDPDAVNGVSQGFMTSGVGWYRKTFVVPDDGRQWSIRFEGVYMDADVWINGIHLGNHAYGYTTFSYDLTAALRKGKTNILAVRVSSKGATSRWYAGSGIYRHVWLEAVSPLHVAEWGTYVRTEGDLVRMRTMFTNTGDTRHARVRTTFFDPKGRQVAIADTAGLVMRNGDTLEIEQLVRIKQPTLWSPGKPALYRAVTELFEDRRAVTSTRPVDRYSTSFGIRTVTFDPSHGFLLNGVPLKLRGGCLHGDNGPLGSRSYDRAEERKVQILLANGFNAVRCSHNPPAPAFLDACDRLGMLVIDEAFDCWMDGKNKDDYHVYFEKRWQRDLRSMLLRDRNHPSIILWSIGNEIPGIDSPNVVSLAHKLVDYVHAVEPSRKVTSAIVSPSVTRDAFAAALDVQGYNYAVNWYEVDHSRHPDRVMIATESYPLEAYKNWKAVEKHSYVVGDFVWTAWDYIGESSLGWRGYPQEKNFYPWNLAFCGDIDICGWKRPASYYRDVLWKAGGDNISIFVTPPVPSFPLNPRRAEWSKWNWHDAVANWNWNADSSLKVNVYSTCQEAELLLNGRSLGRHPVTDGMAEWTVPYAPGVLKAVGYREGVPAKTTTLETTGEPAAIRLTADRSTIKGDGQDLSYITVEVVDKKGRRIPTADNLMHFSISGPGAIAGVGNANPVSTESYQRPQRACWQGRCMVVLRSAKSGGGTIRLTVSGKGLPHQRIDITVRPPVY